jgi:hypothetical protein
MNAESNTLEGSDTEPLPHANWIEAWKSAEREPVFFSKDPWEWRFLERMPPQAHAPVQSPSPCPRGETRIPQSQFESDL